VPGEYTAKLLGNGVPVHVEKACQGFWPEGNLAIEPDPFYRLEKPIHAFCLRQNFFKRILSTG
jgi:hypothetical protein